MDAKKLEALKQKYAGTKGGDIFHPPFAAVAAQTSVFDRQGRLTYMLYGGDELAVRSRPSPAPPADSIRVTRSGGSTAWSAESRARTWSSKPRIAPRTG